MHSPIIYLVEQGTKFAEEIGHELPSDFHQDEIQLCDLIDEADYTKENILKDYKMLDFNFEEEIYSWLKIKPYFDIDTEMNLKISYQDIVTWDEHLLLLLEYFSKAIKQSITEHILYKVDDVDKSLELDEKLGYEYGGFRFVVIHKDVDISEESPESGELMKTKDLFDYARYQLKKNGNDHVVHFKICTNVLGDYHY